MKYYYWGHRHYGGLTIEVLARVSWSVRRDCTDSVSGKAGTLQPEPLRT